MNEQLKRGNLLWESHRMFLPEHKKALLERKAKQNKVDKPLLDDQELEEIGKMIIDSFKRKSEISITYWQDGFFYFVTGTVQQIDEHRKEIKITSKNEIIFIPINCLKSVEIID